MAARICPACSTEADGLMCPTCGMLTEDKLPSGQPEGNAFILEAAQTAEEPAPEEPKEALKEDAPDLFE